MIPKFEDEFKKKIVRLFLEEGKTKKSISTEYNVSVASISNWVKQFRNECQNNEKANNEYNYMKENLRLRKELEEVKKENDFLKKSSGILCKGNRLEAYYFIKKYSEKFGLRWLLRKFDIYPNSYYNFLKNRKERYGFRNNNSGF